MLKYLTLGVILLFSQETFGQSQYFGQNKPRNKSNNFKVLQSTHFQLYNYLDDTQKAKDFVKNSEYWYKLHQEVFKLAFIKPNPIILYNTHPDFQETTTIGGDIGEGTGGVTEGLRTRVVMPLMFTKRQTDHVLGHELVHAFQYQTMTYGSDSTTLSNIQNLPLFMVEGLAEYMSIGRKDAHTSMWMRDAVLNDDIPSIKDLVSKQYKYFPYRWGQVFWAYVTANYGDDIIRPLFKETAIYGLEKAFIKSFKMDSESFSTKFKNDLILYYNRQKQGKETEVRGKVLGASKKGEDMNISPAISPDGKYLAYISSKNVISLDIFIADASNGKTIRKIESTSFGAHVDAYSFIETSGTWSPDSRKFAIVIQSKGKNKLLVIDIINGEKREYQPSSVDSFSNPAWSPDGTQVLFSGLKEGISDIYSFNFRTKETINLTQDDYSDIQPIWSTDGSKVYFVSDRGGNSQKLEKENFRISSLDLNSKKTSTLALFDDTDNMNPQISPDGNSLYFISSPDGFKDLYKINLSNNSLIKLTNYYTGISGITMYSPAISVASRTGEIAYNYFNKGDYNIIIANETHFLNQTVDSKNNIDVSYLVPGKILIGADIVNNNLNKTTFAKNLENLNFEEQKYKPNFKLDYLANSGLGVSTSRFGTGMGGGITALFGDILNNNQLMGTVALNGQIQDFGGQVFYLNQKNPIQFGFSASHIPYRFFGNDSIPYQIINSVGRSNGLDYYEADVQIRNYRLLVDQISGFVIKPFSKSSRLEFGVSRNWFTYNITETNQRGQIGLGTDGNIYDFTSFSRERDKKLNAKELGFNNFNLAQFYTAFVGDNTTFGTVAPLNGYRFRVELAKYLGTASYNSVLMDFRKYKYFKPLTLAGRFMYEGRLNPKNIELLNQINPLYIGFPWYMHGFWGNALSKQQGYITQQNLQGEQMAVANFELRIPFTGPKKLALIPFDYIPSDLNLFFDGGLVWSKQKKIGQSYHFESFGNNTITFKTSPIFTTGLSLRVNVLGYLVVEPYLAVPIYNGQKQPVITGFNFMVPGW
ncbi:tolB protein precursor [Lacihabitans sp. CS3-21]|uniref:tolB protein precursor n=1 Tax=Lacihabitans sp. CS3-21 TaxID=2487332 RepID=UPI0020CBE9E0|nr:tolB protein precursor [Lacihabitans sp. CS3-21]MCP9745781.1 tolB protein precursor [Lacihabitans sp. CS3-21]